MVGATKLEDSRELLGDRVLLQRVVWRVPQPLRGSIHFFKYRLALVVDGVCVLRFDNEAGKGDHKHVDGVEYRYDFVGVASLRRDFALDAGRWLDRHPDVWDPLDGRGA